MKLRFIMKVVKINEQKQLLNMLRSNSIKRIKDAIERYKKENYGKCSPDDVVEAACEQLGREGYIYEYLSEDVTIEF